MYLVDNSIHFPSFRIVGNRGVPGGPVIKTLCFHCGGHHFSSGWETRSCKMQQKKKKNRIMGNTFYDSLVYSTDNHR